VCVRVCVPCADVPCDAIVLHCCCCRASCDAAFPGAAQQVPRPHTPAGTGNDQGLLHVRRSVARARASIACVASQAAGAAVALAVRTSPRRLCVVSTQRRWLCQGSRHLCRPKCQRVCEAAVDVEQRRVAGVGLGVGHVAPVRGEQQGKQTQPRVRQQRRLRCPPQAVRPHCVRGEVLPLLHTPSVAVHVCV
jgi:hypothetical protein